MADNATESAEMAGGRAESTRTAPVYTPVTDIYETKDALVMLLELPGVTPDDVQVTLDKRVLTIAARSRPSLPEGMALTHAEYRDGDFERAFTLSESINGEAIEASAHDGVLRLVLPKAKPEPAKTISVKTS